MYTFDAMQFCITAYINKAKRGFYRASNGIFVKIGRTASEEVVLELI